MSSLPETWRRVKIRLIDLDATRRYLAAIAHIAQRGAADPNPNEVLAVVKVLWVDAARGLAALEGRR